MQLLGPKAPAAAKKEGTELIKGPNVGQKTICEKIKQGKATEVQQCM